MHNLQTIGRILAFYIHCTKRLLYYSKHSFSSLELHAIAPTGKLKSPNTHRNRFLVQHFVHTSGERLSGTTSLGISLDQSFYIHVWAFRLVACVIFLTMLQQYPMLGRQSWEEACMRPQENSELIIAAGVALNHLFVIVCHVAIHYEGLCLKHTKMNETMVKVFL